MNFIFRSCSRRRPDESWVELFPLWTTCYCSIEVDWREYLPQHCLCCSCAYCTLRISADLFLQCMFLCFCFIPRILFSLRKCSLGWIILRMIFSSSDQLLESDFTPQGSGVTWPLRRSCCIFFLSFEILLSQWFWTTIVQMADPPGAGAGGRRQRAREAADDIYTQTEFKHIFMTDYI